MATSNRKPPRKTGRKSTPAAKRSAKSAPKAQSAAPKKLLAPKTPVVAVSKQDKVLEMRQPGSATIIEADERQPDAKLVQAIFRAHAWLRDLKNGEFDTVEALATSVKLHPKLLRQELRYAFLAPRITAAILNGDQPQTLSLARIPKTLPLAWSDQAEALLS